MKEKMLKLITPALNVIITVSIATATFQLGNMYGTSKKEVVKETNP